VNSTLPHVGGPVGPLCVTLCSLCVVCVRACVESLRADDAMQVELVYDLHLTLFGVREVAEKELHAFFVSVRKYVLPPSLPFHPLPQLSTLPLHPPGLLQSSCCFV
jgi:hypothetical protein